MFHIWHLFQVQNSECSVPKIFTKAKKNEGCFSEIYVFTDLGSHSDHRFSLTGVLQVLGLPISNDLGWDRVNFRHSGCYGIMLWIWAENSVANTEMFLLLLRSPWTASRSFLLLSPPHQWGGSKCPKTESYLIKKPNKQNQKSKQITKKLDKFINSLKQNFS